MSDIEERRCPLCGASVKVKKGTDRDFYEFPDHDGCGPFSTTRRGIAALQMENAAAKRDRAAARVRKAKVERKPSPRI